MIKVKICVGTVCYIMGGAELMLVKEHLSPSEVEQVEIEGITCLGLCKNYNPSTPYVMIDGEVLSSVTLDKLLKAIRTKLQSVENNDD